MKKIWYVYGEGSFMCGGDHFNNYQVFKAFRSLGSAQAYLENLRKTYNPHAGNQRDHFDYFDLEEADFEE